jgi:hypothetical protein
MLERIVEPLVERDETVAVLVHGLEVRYVRDARQVRQMRHIGQVRQVRQEKQVRLLSERILVLYCSKMA